jgi:hypothetical protein
MFRRLGGTLKVRLKRERRVQLFFNRPNAGDRLADRPAWREIVRDRHRRELALMVDQKRRDLHYRIDQRGQRRLLSAR